MRRQYVSRYALAAVLGVFQFGPDVRAQATPAARVPGLAQGEPAGLALLEMGVPRGAFGYELDVGGQARVRRGLPSGAHTLRLRVQSDTRGCAVLRTVFLDAAREAVVGEAPVTVCGFHPSVPGVASETRRAVTVGDWRVVWRRERAQGHPGMLRVRFTD